MNAIHAARALARGRGRELVRFFNQTGRLLSAIVRPAFWLFVFAAGFQSVLGVSIAPPYDTYVEYQVYILPGVIGIVLLFQGMQSSLSMVYDREMGVMRLLLTAPCRAGICCSASWLLVCLLSIGQAYAFLIVAALFGIQVPWGGWLYALPAMIAAGLMLGSLGTDLFGSHSAARELRRHDEFRDLSNVLPVVALYPLWKLKESGAEIVYWLSSSTVHLRGRLIRFALYGRSPTAATVGGGQRIAVFPAAAAAMIHRRGVIGRPACGA